MNSETKGGSKEDELEVERRVVAKEFCFIRSDECAALHLFIWCVLQVRIELAMLFWRRTRHPMAAACIGRLLLRGLLKAEKSVEMKSRIQEQIGRLEQLALGVLNQSFEMDPRRTVYVLLAGVTDAAKLSTLQLAAQSNCKNFIAHPACSGLLDDVWCGRLSPRNGWMRVLLCFLLPVLIPFVIVFRTRRSIHTALKRATHLQSSSKQLPHRPDFLGMNATTRRRNVASSNRYVSLSLQRRATSKFFLPTHFKKLKPKGDTFDFLRQLLAKFRIY